MTPGAGRGSSRRVFPAQPPVPPAGGWSRVTARRRVQIACRCARYDPRLELSFGEHVGIVWLDKLFLLTFAPAVRLARECILFNRWKCVRMGVIFYF